MRNNKQKQGFVTVTEPDMKKAIIVDTKLTIDLESGECVRQQIVFKDKKCHDEVTAEMDNFNTKQAELVALNDAVKALRENVVKLFADGKEAEANEARNTYQIEAAKLAAFKLEKPEISGAVAFERTEVSQIDVKKVAALLR